MGLKFRPPRKDEIEVRIGQISEKGLSLLLYQDARVGMTILDETVGPENWQRKHDLINGNLFCSVGVNIAYNKPDLPPIWVWKQDVGVESMTEKEKGQASDSFKRAVVNWGVCRCLYSAPFIWIPAEKVDIREKGGRKVCKDAFYVEKLLIEGDNITALAIKRKGRNGKPDERVFVLSPAKKEDK